MYYQVPPIVVLMLCLGVAPGAAAHTNDAGQSADGASTGDERSKRAYAAFEGQRHLEAALDFESLWQEFHEPRFLFNAAVSRFALRHQAHTVAYLEEYLALPGLSLEERSAASAQLGVARQETIQVGVDVKVTAKDAGEQALELEREPDAPSDLRPVLRRTVTQGGGALAVYLDAGRWTIRGRCPDGSARSVQVVVDRATAGRATLDLVCPPRSDGAEGGARGRRITGVAIGVGGVTGIIIGAAVLGVNARNRKDLLGQDESVCGEATPDTQDHTCHVAYIEASKQASTGAAVLGMGGGLVLGGLTMLVRDDVRRRRVQWAGLGVGAAALIAGIVGRGLFLQKVNEARDDTGNYIGRDWHTFRTNPEVPGYVRGQTAMESLLGLGPALIVASGIGLLTDLHARRAARRGARTTATVSPGFRGVTVTLRF